MENVSQVILRNLERLSPGSIDLVNPEPDELFRKLSLNGRNVRLTSSSHGVYRRLQSLGADAHFEACPNPENTPETTILVLPREKDRLDMLLQATSARMSPLCRLWLAGENRAGIKSARKVLQRHFRQVEKLDNARHCGLLEAWQPLTREPFRLDDFAQRWTIDLAGHQTELVSLPGVFAHGRLDAGTTLLLDVMQNLEPGGSVLDFASGCGVVGIAALCRAPDARLTLLDDSALAIEAGQRSLALNELVATSVASDGLSELEGRFDWILSNPPFHRGIHDNLDIAANFFRDAGTFLSEKGRILVVFNRHLPYEGWLRKLFKNVNCPAQNREFTVIEANKPR